MKKTKQMKRIAITLTDTAINALDELLTYNAHLNKSQIIETLIRQELKRTQKKEKNNKRLLD